MRRSIYLVLFSVLFLSCSDGKEEAYDEILTSLGKNYTVKTTSDSQYLFCWKSNKAAFVKDSVEYRNALRALYSQDLHFMQYLLKTKSQEKTYNNWIETKNFCHSTYYESDLISNKEAVKIIIDNLLLNKNKDTIIISRYIEKAKYKEIEKIVGKGIDVREKYLRYVEKL